MEPTVEHRNVATCGLRMTLASAKGDGEEPSQPCVHRVIPRAWQPSSPHHSASGRKRSASFDDAQAVSPKARCHPSSAMSWAPIANTACASAFREGMI